MDMKTRIKKTAAIALIFLLFTPFLFSDEVTSMWSRLYGRARGYEDRIMIMSGLIEIEDIGMVPFLGEALQDLNSARANDTSTTESMRHNELTKMIVRRLGEYRAAEYADLIFDVFKNTPDIYLKGEAILALGRTVNPDYSDDISIYLRNQNLNIGIENEDKESEVLALASVLALERFRQPVGFAPLFFASIGWYSKTSTVREQAERVLDSLVDDPTDILTDLIRLEGDFAVKLEV
ncbi:MAG: hypothetical protein HN368_23750, partial [Spirochaetales bacterium]|nr:hypothetical protein [Spirochaetales bacterium]